MYANTSHGNSRWFTFNTFVTLSTIFQQQGNTPSQIAFHQLLLNLRNGTPTLSDWTLLMSRKTSSLSHEQNHAFNIVGENIKQIITDIQRFNCQPGESVDL